MLFYTPEFLVFSLLLLAVLAFVHRDTPRKLVLLIASYAFYMWWNPAFIALIVFATAVNYRIAAALAQREDPGARRALLGASLAASLGVLAFFKYSNFMQENLLVSMRLLGFEPHWTTTEIILPVGISFYTFQCLSYTIDVYRRTIPPAASALDFALYVAFFPQLVAGPIVRAAEFLPQLAQPIRLFCDRATFFLILRGLAKKVIVADNLAPLPDAVFADPAAYPSLVVWIATLCFSVQIYCDFSGYSDMAIGIARVLGFEIPKNFAHPYFATNPSEFWRRWHISLSSWLRDYLYISLGGNRAGRLATHRNLMITMLLGGLWHGASWNFVVWGFLHGALLVAHRLYQQWRSRHSGSASGGAAARLLALLAMQYWVLVTWICFRVTDFERMATALHKFIVFDFDFQLASIGLGALSFFSSLALLAAFGLLHLFSWRHEGIEEWLARQPIAVSTGVCLLFGALAFALWPLSDAPFIYFQF